MKDDSIIAEKSFQFAVRIVNLYKYLVSNSNEYVLSRQLLKSGTSIGANVSEASQAQSKADFVSKMNIALKEATESKYWLDLLLATDYLSQSQHNSLINDCVEIEKILVTIVKNSKHN
ncbi:MAG: four helix bundle protein [Ruminococcus sp.]